MNRFGFGIGRLAATIVHAVGYDGRLPAETRDWMVQKFREQLDLLPTAKKGESHG